MDYPIREALVGCGSRRRLYFPAASNLLIDPRGMGFGGEGGIRTHDTLARIPVFETGPFNHSGTSPVPQTIRDFNETGSRFWLPAVPVGRSTS